MKISPTQLQALKGDFENLAASIFEEDTTSVDLIILRQLNEAVYALALSISKLSEANDLLARYALLRSQYEAAVNFAYIFGGRSRNDPDAKKLAQQFSDYGLVEEAESFRRAPEGVRDRSAKLRGMNSYQGKESDEAKEKRSREVLEKYTQSSMTKGSWTTTKLELRATAAVQQCQSDDLSKLFDGHTFYYFLGSSAVHCGPFFLRTFGASKQIQSHNDDGTIALGTSACIMALAASYLGFRELFETQLAFRADPT